MSDIYEAGLKLVACFTNSEAKKGTAEQTVFLKFVMYVYLPWWITAMVPVSAPCHDLKSESYQQHLAVQGNKPGGCQRCTDGY